MKNKLKSLAITGWLFCAILQLCAQGYIVPNGVIYSGYSLLLGGYEIDVKHDPTNSIYTGFSLNPNGKTPVTTLYTNTFSFNAYVDVGVRVFLVSSNQPITQQAIQSGSYTELMFPNAYVFNNNSPFYVGLYTGNQNFAPPNGIYNDPLFGWARLVNNQGVIQMLDSALVYQAGGVFAGTQNIIPVPEPSVLSLYWFGALLFGRRVWWQFSQRKIRW